MVVRHKKIYLAGPIMHDNNLGWRDLIGRWYDGILDVHIVNPLDIELEDGTDKEDLLENKSLMRQKAGMIVRSDLEAIDGCTGVLALWKDDVQMAGTPMEVFYSYRQGKRVALVYDGDFDTLSPWLHEHSDGMFRSLRRAMDFLTRERRSHDE